jgi:hypothetical protein
MRKNKSTKIIKKTLTVVNLLERKDINLYFVGGKPINNLDFYQELQKKIDLDTISFGQKPAIFAKKLDTASNVKISVSSYY